ncbi:MAG: NAD(P)H-hydrate epimerase, partial [Fidelibacterota bacterium]
IEVSAVLAGEESRLKPVPAKRWKTLKLLPTDRVYSGTQTPEDRFREADLIVDAILGYGLSGTPRGRQAQVIGEILESGNGAILSLDVPSGLDSTTGNVPGDCIAARATMTLALPKTGLMKASSSRYTGDLYVADIGVPPHLYSRIGLKSFQPFKEETILQVLPETSG